MTTAAKPGDWMENFTYQSAGVHFLIALSTMLVTALFSRAPGPLDYASGALAIFVIGKEYWYDLNYETGETWKSSTVDALGYLAGYIVVLVLLHFAGRL